MAHIDLYKFRGFKVYTPELPDNPDEPLFGIKFFWPCALDNESGLIRCDPYGDDYTNGEWPTYQDMYPSLYVGSEIVEGHDGALKKVLDNTSSYLSLIHI